MIVSASDRSEAELEAIDSQISDAARRKAKIELGVHDMVDGLTADCRYCM